MYEHDLFPSAPSIYLQEHTQHFRKNGKEYPCIDVEPILYVSGTKYKTFLVASLYNSLQIIVPLKSSIFWDKTSCSPLKVNRLFGGTCHLYIQD
jgi:hypothetical protein